MGSLISELLQQNINKITHAKISGRATVMNIIMYQIIVIIINVLKKRKEIKLKKNYTCNMAEEIIIDLPQCILMPLQTKAQPCDGHDQSIKALLLQLIS